MLDDLTLQWMIEGEMEGKGRGRRGRRGGDDSDSGEEDPNPNSLMLCYGGDKRRGLNLLSSWIRIQIQNSLMWYNCWLTT